MKNIQKYTVVFMTKIFSYICPPNNKTFEYAVASEIHRYRQTVP